MQGIRFAPLQIPPGAATATTPAADAGSGFAGRMQEALAGANRELLTAENTASQLASGEVDVVDAALALSKADLTLRHLVALRNRILESFQDVMRMPV